MIDGELGSEDETNPATELCLPEELDPAYFKDFNLNAANRFCHLVRYYQAAENLAIGHNEPLLEGLIQSSKGESTITFDGASSRLWDNCSHVTRGIEHDDDLSNTGLQKLSESAVKDSLLPWERWQEDLDYTVPSCGDTWSQAKGIAFPTLNLSRQLHQFRLLLLLPSFDDDESPLSGLLVVSTLYLHSCFKALRHSRGNPGMFGRMLIDGKPAEITKNLELFLRHFRHPKYCQMLYVRELCVNRQDDEEKSKMLTGVLHGLVEDCSCGVIDMNKAIYKLDSEGLIPEPPRVSEKLWHTAPSEAGEIPWHAPVPLKLYANNSLVDKADITEAEVATLPEYEYVPLDIVAREIRLLAVYPAESSEDPIVVDVVYVPLRMDVFYHALSYCWGTPEKVRVLKSWNMKISVAENLYAALHAFRDEVPKTNTRPWYIWVDAICINQNNNDEKAWTIARMHDIYEAAKIVQISLAPVQLLTPKVRALLEDFVQDKIDCASEEPLDELGSLDAWTDLYALFRQPYFGRRWIVQELASASAPLITMAGGQDRALRIFSIAAWVMSKRFPELWKLWTTKKHPIIQQYEELSKCAMFTDVGFLFPVLEQIRHQFERVQRIDNIRYLRMHNEPPSFLFLAVLTQSAGCADPRDVLYSLWNICRERSGSSLPLSYDASIERCYIAFTKFYASLTSSLDVMCISQSLSRSDDLEPSVNLDWSSGLVVPSWCPDYRCGEEISSLIRYVFVKFGTSISPKLDFPPYHADTIEREARPSTCFRFLDDTLVARGVFLDTVGYVSNKSFEILPWSDISGISFDNIGRGWDEVALRKVKRGRNGLTQVEYLNDDLLTDFLNMIVGETGSITATLSTEDPEEGVLKYTYHDLSPYMPTADFSERAATLTKGRRMIVTREGYMGLAPYHVNEGLKIAILLGCSVPVLLEWVDEDQGSRNVKPGWHFRGDCFIQHWMQGQMMKQYGKTTRDAWEALSGPDFEIHIQ